MCQLYLNKKCNPDPHPSGEKGNMPRDEGQTEQDSRTWPATSVATSQGADQNPCSNQPKTVGTWSGTTASLILAPAFNSGPSREHQIYHLTSHIGFPVPTALEESPLLQKAPSSLPALSLCQMQEWQLAPSSGKLWIAGSVLSWVVFLYFHR